MNKEDLLQRLKSELNTSGSLWVYDEYERGELIEDDDPPLAAFNWGSEVGYVETMKYIISILEGQDCVEN